MSIGQYRNLTLAQIADAASARQHHTAKLSGEDNRSCMQHWCPDLPPEHSPTWSTEAALTVLQDKWIFLLGDSSLRYFNAALIRLLNGSLADHHFADENRHYLPSDLTIGARHGACGYKETTLADLTHGSGHVLTDRNDDRGQACHREYVDLRRRVRVTYVFRVRSVQITRAVGSLISESQKPDVFVLATGTWDYHNFGVPPGAAALAARDFATQMQRDAPHALVVFANAVDCNARCPRKANDQLFNCRLGQLLGPHLRGSWPLVHLLDRGREGADYPCFNHIDPVIKHCQPCWNRCEGNHAFADVVRGHVDDLLDVLHARRGADGNDGAGSARHAAPSPRRQHTPHRHSNCTKTVT